MLKKSNDTAKIVECLKKENKETNFQWKKVLYRFLRIAENFIGMFITWIFGPRDSTAKLLNFYLSELKFSNSNAEKIFQKLKE